MDTKYSISATQITEDWFRRWGSPDPPKDHAEFQRWLPLRRRRDPRQIVRKLLELSTGLSKGAIAHYFLGRDEHFNKETIASLDAICRALDFPLPRRGGYSTGGSAKRSHKHIAIITDLDHPPSPRYHVEILFRVIKAVEQANYVTSIFHASTSDPSMQTVTERLLRIAKPDAIVWFRITPDGASLYAIRTYSTELPCLVIAGARLLYPPPVIGHIFPDQASLETSVDGWARRLRDLSSGQFSEVVLVSLAREELSYNFPQESAEPSIRNERIDLVMKALTGVGLSATNEPVPDYSGSGAFPVFRKHPNALGFVCLSDELAVAMKHLWMAAGRTGDPSDRIIGFDNSSLAEEYAITSIGQSIDKIGDLLVRRLGEFFNARKSDAPETWPSCKNLMTELSLTVRSGD